MTPTKQRKERVYCKCKKCFGWKDYKCNKCGNWIKFGGVDIQPYDKKSGQITYSDLNPNDVVFTPDKIAKQIVDMFPIKGKILEPCSGEGAFLRVLPKGTDWCEITKGRDFFDYNKKVDWIVTNPPYSVFEKFMAHAFELSENVVFLVPVAKVLKSWGTIQRVKQYGGIVSIWLVPASRCGFPFGFPAGAFHFKRGYKGATQFTYAPDEKDNQEKLL